MSRRIAIYLPSLEGGGAERVMLYLSKGFAQRGLCVDMVLAQAKGPYLELLPDGVRLIDLKARRTLTSLLPLLRYLRRECPDALVSTLPHANVVALIVKKLFAKQLRVVARRESNFQMEYANAGFKDRLTLRLERRLYPFANAVVAVSDGVADDLKRSAPNSSHLIQIIPNPVVWPDHAEKAGQPVKHPWFGDPDVPVILAAGRLVAQKDHATLLRAFAELAKSRPARLVVLGGGPERHNLIALARNLEIAHAVDFPGFQINPFAFMAKSSAFVLSSVYEGLGMVLIEAMACGTPVISTDCPSGPWEILEGGKWGRLVPVGDSQALAKAMRDTLDNPIAPSLLISRARAYSAEALIDQYLGVLTTC